MSSSKKSVVLITGISSGIGLAAARMLAASGWTVIGTRRSPGEPLAGVDQRIMDVTSDQSVSESIASVLRDYGVIDAVINNAGAGHVATLEDDSMAEIRRVFEVNCFGVIRVSKAVLPALRASRGRLIAVTSVGGVIGQPFNDAYCAAKFAVEGLMESLAPVARAAGVLVSVIEPGFVQTEFVNNIGLDVMPVSAPYAEMREQYFRRVRERLPLGQSADDVGRVVVEVLHDPSPKLRYQTSPNSAALVGSKLTDLNGEAVQSFTRTWISAPAE